VSEIARELLERYVAGTVTPEEAEWVEGWLAEDPTRWARLAELREAAADADLDDAAVGRAMGEVWERLAPEVGEAGGRPVYRPTAPGRRFRITGGRRTLLGPLAAALAVLTVGGGLAASLWLKGRNAPPGRMQVASTAPGERASFHLPDGTRVMLSVASRLRYPARFESARREVSLEGEAYFDVVHQGVGPFVVKAGGLVARDLATRFTVRAYPEESGARVVVREGKVAIRAADRGPEQEVAPGQLGRLGQGGTPLVETADTGALFAWTEGKLVFEATPLREALPQLGRWFDLDFRLADDSLGDIPLTATLKSQPTPDVLGSLSASLGLLHRQRGRTVTLYSAVPTR
jgi:transmembrane sensor